MPIHVKTNSAVTQVHLLGTGYITEHDTLLNKLDFKPKFGKMKLLLESNILYVGTEFKASSNTIDPFAKADWYQLGAMIGGILKANEIEELQLNSSLPIEKNELEMILLGILQSGVDFDKYMKESSSVVFDIYLQDSFSIILNLFSQNYISAVHSAVKLTRNLVDDTPQFINPNTMPGIIKKELGSEKISIKEYSYEDLQRMEMDGIVAVGKASIHKPVMIHTTLKPLEEVKKKIVLVGKGLTYDCGGLDIKTGGHMAGMKCDMAGSATMFGTIKALSELNLRNTEVHWISAFAENMIAGNAYKADDILTTYSGQTVEVDNTDAEGRLTLADVLTFSTFLKPDYIVDAATLTGACMAAIGHNFTGLMSNSLELKNKLMFNFEAQNEATTWVNMPERMRKGVKGEISDLMNTSNMERQAGHATAGIFLSHFVDQNLFRNPKLDIPEPKVYAWAHLDIAGSAYNHKFNSLGVSGATGQSVRSLVNWILTEDNN